MFFAGDRGFDPRGVGVDLQGADHVPAVDDGGIDLQSSLGALPGLGRVLRGIELLEICHRLARLDRLAEMV